MSPLKREAPVFAGICKINEYHGQGISGKLGVVKDIGNKDPNLIATLAPAIVFVKEGKKIVSQQWAAVSINMTGDLRRKLDTGGKDEGKFFTIIYKDDEPVKGKPDPMKIFDVDEISRKEFSELWIDADDEHVKDAYPQAEKKTAAKPTSSITGGDEFEGPYNEDKDDDFPF